MGQSRLQLVALHIMAQLVAECHDPFIQHYRVDDLNYIIVLCNAYHCIYFRELFVHLLLITLRKATRYDYLLVDTVILAADSFHYLLDSFFFSALDKAAGIDYYNICKTRLVYYFEAGFSYLCKHKFGIALVLRTTERYHTDFYCVCHYFFLPFRIPYVLYFRDLLIVIFFFVIISVFHAG